MSCLGTFKVQKIIPIPACTLHTDHFKTLPTTTDGLLSANRNLNNNGESTIDNVLTKSYPAGNLRDAAIDSVLKNNPRAASIF